MEARLVTHHANLIDTVTLLDKLAPVVPAVVERLYELCSEKLYNGSRWIHMPHSPISLEKEMYAPFVEICQLIHNAIHDTSSLPKDTEWKPQKKSLRELQHGPDWRQVEVVNGQWNTLPNDAPKCRDNNPADPRPDVDFSVEIEDRQKFVDLVNSLVQELATIQERCEQPVFEFQYRRTNVDLERELSESRAKLDDKMRRWWLQPHVVGEFKPGRTTAEIAEATFRTVGALRHILREQMDRRFVFGVTLCQDKLDLWFCDRSGLLGTNTPIDIHEDPRSFIRVIAAFSILKPEQIGWDTTMKLYSPVSGTCVSSYLHRFDIDDSVYETHWAIEMPAEGKSEQDARETFITVRCLKAIGLEDPCSRATLVWEAVKYSELPDPKKVYVLKQSWRPSVQGVETAAQEMATEDVTSEARSEAEMYDLIRQDPDPDRDPLKSDAEYVAQMYSYEDVCIGGIVDTTLGLIRQDLAMDPYVPTQHNHKRLRGRYESSELLARAVTITKDKITTVKAEEATVPLDRTHTRIVLKTFGWPIKYFVDLEELLRMFIDATKGHRFLYLRRGIVHRDVSSGNLLICPSSIYDVCTTTGRIIDLDHSKATSGFVELYGDLVDVPPTVIHYFANEPVDPEFIRLLWNRLCVILSTKLDRRIVTPMRGYVDQLIGVDEPDHMLTCKELGWELEGPLRCPSFDDHTPSRGPRSGTAPFMSAEVLSRMRLRYLPNTPGDDVHVHEATHDMESFFWVLVYLCLTRSGPGGHRRKEMSTCDAPDDDRKRLWHGVLCLFDGDLAMLSANKTLLHQKPKVFTDYVLPLVHPYFDDLKGLLQDWWDLLMRAYKFRLIEYDMIHDRVIALLERTLAAIREKTKDQTEEHPFTVEERKRREDDLGRIREAFAATPPLTSAQPPIAGLSPGTIPVTVDTSNISHSPSATTQPSKKRKIQES